MDEGSGSDDDAARSETSRSRSNRDGIHRQFEALLDVLTARRRRYALYYLRDHEVADLTSLATHLAAIERDVPVSALGDDDIARVETELVHADLPALADAQLLEFDRRSGTLRYSAPPPLLEALLRLSAHIDAPDERPG